MISHWIGIAAAIHVRAGVSGGFAMFSHGRHDAVQRVQPGDWVTYYCPRKGLNEGPQVRAFTAIGEVMPGEPGEREMLQGLTGWYRKMRWLDAGSADVYPLLDQFSFVTNRQHWGMYFRKSLFRIERSDFALIAEAMGVGDAFRQSA